LIQINERLVHRSAEPLRRQPAGPGRIRTLVPAT
jgi:hypothetical protein